MGKLNKKVAVVTGGARGIGRQIALTFATEGADIVIGDVTEMEATAQEMIGLGREVVRVKTNVAIKSEVKNLIDTAMDKFKKVDILVNNAGITRNVGLLEMAEEDWDVVLNVNLKGIFLCTQAAARYMIERKYGKIINIASVAGQSVGFYPGQSNYAASKAGVIQLTKAYAQELGPYGINVNAIAQGLIMTDILHLQGTPEEVEVLVEERRRSTALVRTGTTQDIANLALFLASDDSSFITGQVIAADGGRSS